jgi:hypothetical protein
VNGGVWSEWSTGPGITTYAHRGPIPNFAWDPDPASTETQIFFDNTTRTFDGSDPVTINYSWTFGSGAYSPGSTLFEPIAIYSTVGNKQVRLEADDGSGVCSRERTVNVGSGLPLPIFREIIPR